MRFLGYKKRYVHVHWLHNLIAALCSVHAV